MRICSFLPSATEIVYSLGLGDDLFGVSYGCDYPPQAKSKPVVVRGAFESADYSSMDIDALVGEGLKQGRPMYRIDHAALERAQPDLLITQELCDVCAISYSQVMKAAQLLPVQPQVLSLAPSSLDDVLEDVRRVGQAAGRIQEAEELIASLRRRISSVAQRAATATVRPRVVCLEWLDPPMVGGHWIPEMVDLAGGRDCLALPGKPSRHVAWEEVVRAEPEVILLAPCGFDIGRTLSELPALSSRKEWSTLPAVRQGSVYATNDQAYYSRPGPRLVDGLEMMAKALHPDLFADLPATEEIIRLDPPS